TGGNAIQSILAALFARERTGHGQSIDVALFDSGLHFLANVASGYLNTGTNPTRFGNAHPSIVPYQLFDTADGAIALAVGNDQQYRRFCRDGPGGGGLCTPERVPPHAGRTRNPRLLAPELAAAIKRFDTKALIAKLHANGIPGGELRTVAEAFASEETKARDAVMSAPDPQLGEVRMVRSPLRMSGSPTTTPVAPPTLGQHTREVLGTVLDYSAERIDAL